MKSNINMSFYPDHLKHSPYCNYTHCSSTETSPNLSYTLGVHVSIFPNSTLPVSPQPLLPLPTDRSPIPSLSPSPQLPSQPQPRTLAPSPQYQVPHPPALLSAPSPAPSPYLHPLLHPSLQPTAPTPTPVFS